MNKALLDSDIYSEVLKAIDQTVLRNATAFRQAQGRLTFSVITVMEIIQGLQRSSLAETHPGVPPPSSPRKSYPSTKTPLTWPA